MHPNMAGATAPNTAGALHLRALRREEGGEFSRLLPPPCLRALALQLVLPCALPLLGRRHRRPPRLLRLSTQSTQRTQRTQSTRRVGRGLRASVWARRV
eukprot:1318210-Prymnesium_polylepis.1